ncbi:RNA-binding protein [Glutamicibacter sp. BW80]|nr:RNA-binding protein [Glutamicibacter sp. BW80]PCC33339.1 RNA-binding protein [Glutamicibacter sp. BW77]HBV08850.1 RNA-binding S4 domain-containing protein [Micrococcaceae bacterium]
MRDDGTMANSEVFPIQIRDESIRLGQLLKLASLAEDGIHAKQLIEDGQVLVNGKIETRRGAQMRNGDTISVRGESVVVETA